MLTVATTLPVRHAGRVREEQGWTGGAPPVEAALVTAPPELLGGLLSDLVHHADRVDVDPVGQAAVAHAQLEVVHPFADGNARVGRLLVSWLLTRRLALVTPPPVSMRMAADRAGHLAELTTFRLGGHESWVRWFADVVAGAAVSQVRLVEGVAALQPRWRLALQGSCGGRWLRTDALAWQVLALLPRHLVLTADVVSRVSGRSPRAATEALHRLVAAGVLVPWGTRLVRRPGRPVLRRVAPELPELVSAPG